MGKNGFESGSAYQVELSVENYCGVEKTAATTFTLPDFGCEIEAPLPPPIELTPGLLSGGSTELSIRYEMEEDMNVEIFGLHTVYGKYDGMIKVAGDQVSGIYEIQLDVSNWYDGTNVIVFRFDETIYSSSFVKL